MEVIEISNEWRQIEVDLQKLFQNSRVIGSGVVIKTPKEDHGRFELDIHSSSKQILDTISESITFTPSTMSPTGNYEFKIRSQDTGLRIQGTQPHDLLNIVIAKPTLYAIQIRGKKNLNAVILTFRSLDPHAPFKFWAEYYVALKYTPIYFDQIVEHLQALHRRHKSYYEIVIEST
jgi:hypothetical protein